MKVYLVLLDNGREHTEWSWSIESIFDNVDSAFDHIMSLGFVIPLKNVYSCFDSFDGFMWAKRKPLTCQYNLTTEKAHQRKCWMSCEAGGTNKCLLWHLDYSKAWIIEHEVLHG